MLQKKVSIIVPLYNVEKYIAQCIESILNQHFKNFELIIINDGSSDSSVDIVQQYVKKDTRIILINQENSGVSATRNNGLRRATGKYVVFIDADDFVAPDFLDYMLELSDQYDSDFCFSQNAFTKIDEEQIESDDIHTLSSDQAIALLLSPRVIVGCWNKIYRRSFLVENDLHFSTSLFYGEGLNFITRVADKANSICVGDRKVYYYRRNNETSATTSFNIEKMRNGETALDRIRQEIDSDSQEIRDMFCLHKALFSLGAITRILNNRVKKLYKSDYLRWRKMLRENTRKISFSKNVSIYRKVMLWGGIMPFFNGAA